jgi:enoyl-CoA hydratase/carnithine racemase
MDQLLMAREGRMLRLTLNRPEKNNLLTSSLCRDLVSALDNAERDAEVGCVLLEAAGPMFCGGLELAEEPQPEADEARERLFTFGREYRKPVVAAVQGPCLGAGVGLVANAHVVLAAQGVQFGLTEIRHGCWPYVTHRALAWAMGERRVVELSLTGRVFSAQDAMLFGLVHEIAPAFELDDRATAVARRLAESNSAALERGLEFVRRSRDMDWAEAGRQAAGMPVNRQ